MALGAILGAVFGGVSSAIGTSSQNAQAQAAADQQNKYNRKVYDFQVKEQERQYEYAVEGLEIAKRNNEANLQFQEATRNQQYDYGMGIRAYEHTQNMRVFDAQVSGAVQQQSFNELATNAALVDQNRLIHEQLLSISFDETGTLLDYGAAAAGLGLRKRQARGAAATQAQATRIETLKASGAAQARGAGGRSAARNIQGMVAEAGARQAAIIDDLMYNLEATDQQLYKMNQQLILDKVGFEMTRESAQMSDMVARTKIQQQSLQAAIDAASRIGLKPEIAPPLPVPLALPRPEYQNVFKPGVPPAPMAAVAMQQNMFSSVLSGAVGGAQMGASIQSSFGSGGGFSGGGQSGGLAGISPASMGQGVSYGGGAATGAFSGATGIGGTSWGGGSWGGGFGVGK
jgi:hypothetical protein